MSALDNNVSVWNDGILPEGYPYDPITQRLGVVAPVNFGLGSPMTYQPSNSGAVEANGFHPSWKFVPPPGVGDAPQHVWATWSLIPFSFDGPGDRPAGYLKSYLSPIVQNFRALYQGMAIDGGNLLMTGLYTPAPLTSPSYNANAGATGL